MQGTVISNQEAKLIKKRQLESYFPQCRNATTRNKKNTKTLIFGIEMSTGPKSKAGNAL